MSETDENAPAPGGEIQTAEVEAPRKGRQKADLSQLDHDKDGVPGGSLPHVHTFLTTRWSEAFGAQGRFVGLTNAAAAPHLEPTEASAGDDGAVAATDAAGKPIEGKFVMPPLLIEPTEEQLAMRRR